MGIRGHEMAVTSWHWNEHVSKASGKAMLRVTYYGALSDPSVTEYLCVLHDGIAGQRALGLMATIARECGVPLQSDDDDSLADVALRMNTGKPPTEIEYTKDGKFHRVMRRIWHEAS
jgi:hypothetical protein